jgi:three-Cys-motif partner protein
MDEPTDDGFVIPEVGAWAKRKYHFLGRYLEAFNTAMKDKNWPGGRHYIDLFSGAGLARIRGTGELVWSSAMLAARTSVPFTCLHLCDRDAGNVSALRARLARHATSIEARITQGDANDKIKEMIKSIPAKSLSVAFVDPYGLHFDFETARLLSHGARADLVVLVADNMDALRNWSVYYENNPNSSLDRFLGTSTWRSAFAKYPVERHAEVLRGLYQKQLQVLGYSQFAFETVQNSSGSDIYKFLFACKHAAGLKIWKGISMVDESGQRKLF